MKVTRFTVNKGNARQIQSPVVRVEAKGRGCGLLGCNCSPLNFITISDGELGLTVELSAIEAQTLMLEGTLDIQEERKGGKDALDSN